MSKGYYWKMLFVAATATLPECAHTLIDVTLTTYRPPLTTWQQSGLPHPSPHTLSTPLRFQRLQAPTQRRQT